MSNRIAGGEVRLQPEADAERRRARSWCRTRRASARTPRGAPGCPTTPGRRRRASRTRSSANQFRDDLGFIPRLGGRHPHRAASCAGCGPAWSSGAVREWRATLPVQPLPARRHRRRDADRRTVADRRVPGRVDGRADGGAQRGVPPHAVPAAGHAAGLQDPDRALPVPDGGPGLHRPQLEAPRPGRGRAGRRLLRRRSRGSDGRRAACASTSTWRPRRR